MPLIRTNRAWGCCQCRREVVFALWSNNCPDCSHSKCSDCWRLDMRPQEPPISPLSERSAVLASPPPSARSRKDARELPHRHKDSQTSKPPPVQHDIYSAPDVVGSDSKKQPRKRDKPTRMPPPSIPTVLQTEPPRKEGPFPLYLVDDPELLQRWNTSILGAISSRADEFEGLNSIHLARQGPTKETSKPTIFVSIDNAKQESVLQMKISSLLTASEQGSVEFKFEVSAPRRTMDIQTRDLPPICKPSNTSFQTYPDSGDSIGIQDRVDSTATLGGYLSVDSRLFGVTVDHLIPDEGIRDGEVNITHPSEQDKMDVDRWTWLWQYTLLLDGYCPSCLDVIRRWCRAGNMDVPAQLEDDGCSCPRNHAFREVIERLEQTFKPDRLGTVHCRSGRRSRPSVAGDGAYMVEMDWLLFGIDSWHTPLSKVVAMRSESMSLSPVVGGASVYARGRTSGYQTGLISKSMSGIRHGRRITLECSVIQGPNMSADHWLSSGIGVDGDSGAWLLDYDDDKVYGMVWGRDQAWTNPIALFTPIQEMLMDIKERMGATDICLPEYSSSATAIGKGKARLDESSAQEDLSVSEDEPQSPKEKLDMSSARQDLPTKEEPQSALIKIDEDIPSREMMCEGSYTDGKAMEDS